MDEESVVAEFLRGKGLSRGSPLSLTSVAQYHKSQSTCTFMEKEGWLKKLSKRGARYNRRYFIVKEGRIQSYTSDREPDDQKNGILLSQCIAMEDQEDLGHIRLVSTFESMTLIGESPEDTQAWLLFLNSASCLEMYKEKCAQENIKPNLQVTDSLYNVCRSMVISNHDLGYMMLICLNDMLQNNTTITSLEIKSCNLSDSAIQCFIKYISSAKGLERISFSENRISSYSMPELCESLYYCVSLVSLDLSHNEIGSLGLEFLAELLLVNATIQKVNVASNGISSEGPGLSALVASLSGNSSVTELVLDGNPFGDEGLIMIADALKSSAITQLKKLSLKSVNAGPLGLQVLIDALAVNECVQSLDISENNFDKETAKKLVSVFSRRHIQTITVGCPNLEEGEVSMALCKLMNISYLPSRFILQRRPTS